MFNPFDRANHADLLRGMTRRSLGGPDSAPPSLLASQQALQVYLAQPFAPPKLGSPEAGLFSSAVLFAQKDPTVKAYFAKLQAALKHKIASLKQKGFAETDQAALDKLPNRIAVAQDAVDKSKKYYLEAIDRADKAFLNFLDWLTKSVQLFVRDAGDEEWTFKHVEDYTGMPVGLRTDTLDSDAKRAHNAEYVTAALYGEPKFLDGFKGNDYADLKSHLNDTTYFRDGAVLQAIPADSAPFGLFTVKGSDRYSVGATSYQKGEKNPEVPTAGVVIHNGVPKWKSVQSGTTYAGAYFLSLLFAPKDGKPGRIVYLGESRHNTVAAAAVWNEDFIPKLAAATKLYQQFVGNTNILRDLLVSRDTLTKSVADENAAAQAEQAAYEQGLADANAIKSKLSGFLLGYAQALGEQYTKAAELNGLTAAREAMQAQNAKWFAEYDAMTKQGNALLAQADTETDEGRKAALRIEAGRRLGRALEMNARGQSLRDGALKRYGDRRSGAVKDLADAQAKSQLSLPTVVLAQVQTDTAKIAELTAQIAAIQAAADATKQEIIDGLNKLPEGFKPPNAPPPPAAKAKGGAGWILALGAAGAAFIAYKRGH
jgi:peptidoglycan hydrolase-like protein with peptidoglycan-binding domain